MISVYLILDNFLCQLFVVIIYISFLNIIEPFSRIRVANGSIII